MFVVITECANSHIDHSDVMQILSSRLTVIKKARESWTTADPKVSTCDHTYAG